MKTTAHPSTFVIFGVTGDLALRKLLPALLSLYVKKLLPDNFSIVGVARRPMSKEDFRAFIRDGMRERAYCHPNEAVKHFIDRMIYVEGQFDTPDLYEKLKKTLSEIDGRHNLCMSKIFHLSVPPTLYENILHGLHNSGLTASCDEGLGWTRVLVEKPFGIDPESAERLDALLGKLFKEKQIFRIDHYLAKETIQNILAFRTENPMFESLWNSNHIDAIELKLHERGDIAKRGNFYDQVGAFRDVGQNHLLQMLAMVAMDLPKEATSEAVREKRAEALAALMPIPLKTANKCVLRGQYAGFSTEEGVKGGTTTETYFRVAAYVKNKRFKNVPFILESGKALKENKVTLTIFFKPVKGREERNILSFKIQPDEGIQLRFYVKRPGFGHEIIPKTLGFNYEEFGTATEIPDAYDRVIWDAICGDQMLFASTEEVRYSWKFTESVLNAFEKLPLYIYEKGSRGPEIP